MEACRGVMAGAVLVGLTRGREMCVANLGPEMCVANLGPEMCVANLGPEMCVANLGPRHRLPTPVDRSREVGRVAEATPLSCSAMSDTSMDDPGGTVTSLLHQVRIGDLKARDRLFAVLYDELRRRAAARIARGNGAGFDATGLVHEACAKLLSRGSIEASDRNHFFAIFSLAMRDAVADALRQDHARRRGGDRPRESLIEFEADGAILRIDVLVIQEALDALKAVDPDAARIVDLRVFCGQSLAEAGEVMGIGRSVARGHWDYGRAWLRRWLESGQPSTL